MYVTYSISTSRGIYPPETFAYAYQGVYRRLMQYFPQ